MFEIKMDFLVPFKFEESKIVNVPFKLEVSKIDFGFSFITFSPPSDVRLDGFLF